VSKKLVPYSVPVAIDGGVMFAALVRLVVAITFVLSALGSAIGLVVSAQSSPEPQRYGRNDLGYASQWDLRALDASGWMP
jgi:hypothetical protein